MDGEIRQIEKYYYNLRLLLQPLLHFEEQGLFAYAT